MPQMSPLMWLMLMAFFFSVYMVFMMINYFNLNYFPVNKFFESKNIFKLKMMTNLFSSFLHPFLFL